MEIGRGAGGVAWGAGCASKALLAVKQSLPIYLSAGRPASGAERSALPFSTCAGAITGTSSSGGMGSSSITSGQVIGQLRALKKNKVLWGRMDEGAEGVRGRGDGG